MVLGAVLHVGKKLSKHTIHRDRTNKDREMDLVHTLPHMGQEVTFSFLRKHGASEKMGGS